MQQDTTYRASRERGVCRRAATSRDCRFSHDWLPSDSDPDVVLPFRRSDHPTCERSAFDALWCETHREAFADDASLCDAVRFPRSR